MLVGSRANLAMRLDLYQAETARIAADQSALLSQAKTILNQGRALTPLEQSGVLHALQILIENAIGKAKQWLKANDQPVPISGYDAFKALANSDQFVVAFLLNSFRDGQPDSR